MDGLESPRLTLREGAQKIVARCNVLRFGGGRCSDQYSLGPTKNVWACGLGRAEIESR